MVGGSVVDVRVVDSSKLFVMCQDRTYGDRCAIHVGRCERADRIQVGDSLWWQGFKAFHTPAANRLPEAQSQRHGHRQGVDFDIELTKIGYSGIRYVGSNN